MAHPQKHNVGGSSPEPSNGSNQALTDLEAQVTQLTKQFQDITNTQATLTQQINDLMNRLSASSNTNQQ
jgi:cell division protein FtsB